MRSLVGRASHTLFDESIAGRQTLAQAPQPNHSPMNPRRQAISTPRTNTKQLHRKNGRGSEPVGKMNAEPSGADLPHALRRINAGRQNLA